MRSNAEHEAIASHHYGIPGFDYRSLLIMCLLEIGLDC